MSRSDDFAREATYDKYHLSLDDPDAPRNAVVARATDAQGHPGKKVGFLTWFGGTPEYNGHNTDGGVISRAYVSSQFRRKGIASAMLDFARAHHPESDIRHSNALSPDGAAWAEGHK